MRWLLLQVWCADLPTPLCSVGLRIVVLAAPPHPVPPPPSFSFLVILPSLFYTAAWQRSWREFKYNLVSLSSLAVLLVFFTAFGVAFVAKGWLPGFNWRPDFFSERCFRRCRTASTS